MQAQPNIKNIYIIPLLLLLSVICYWKMFDNYFYLDDTNGVFAGYLLSRDITKIFNYNFDAIYMSPLRRVVVALSYVPNYLISGYEPWSYYLVNLLLHFGNSVLVYLVVKRLTSNQSVGLLTAVLFSASLNKADAVMMIAHRTTLMGAFFALLSLFLYIRLVLEGFSRRLFLYTLLSFVAALGSYETALVLPGIFIAYGLIYKGREFFKRELLFVNALFLALVVILVWFLELKPGGAITETSVTGKAYHIFRNVLAIFPSFIIPPFLLHDPNEVYHGATAYWGWIELLSIGLIVLIAIANVKIRERLIYFGLIFFLIAAVPTATVIWGYDPIYPFFYRIRSSIGKYSYFLSVGFYIIAAALMYKLYVTLLNRINKVLIKTVSYILILIYLGFNIHWLQEREKNWDMVSNAARREVDSLRSLNLDLSGHANIFTVGDFILYTKYMESLLQVIYDNPNIKVLKVNNDIEKLTIERTLPSKDYLFVVRNDMSGIQNVEVINVFEVVTQKGHIYLMRRIK